jgi:hypothetical protein
MYFVTTKREGYVLFCTTPSERAALALTDKEVVHLFGRRSVAGEWQLLAQWNASDYSHTDFLATLHHVDEPAEPEGLLAFVPANVRR